MCYFKKNEKDLVVEDLLRQLNMLLSGWNIALICMCDGFYWKKFTTKMQTYNLHLQIY